MRLSRVLLITVVMVGVFWVLTTHFEPTLFERPTVIGSGGSDLRVVVEGEDIREVGRFVAEKLSTIDGVTGTSTHFLLRRYKEDKDLFVEIDEDPRLVVTP